MEVGCKILAQCQKYYTRTVRVRTLEIALFGQQILKIAPKFSTHTAHNNTTNVHSSTKYIIKPCVVKLKYFLCIILYIE